MVQPLFQVPAHRLGEGIAGPAAFLDALQHGPGGLLVQFRQLPLHGHLRLRLLRGDGVKVLGPAAGEQACGETGYGRMLEPAEIYAETAAMLAGQGVLRGRRITAVAKCRFDIEVCGGIYENSPCVIDGNLVSGRTFHDHGHYMGAWMALLEEERRRRDALR